VLYGSGYEGALFANAGRFVHLETSDPLPGHELLRHFLMQPLSAPPPT
jgi:hypothetical protein